MSRPRNKRASITTYGSGGLFVVYEGLTCAAAYPQDAWREAMQHFYVSGVLLGRNPPPAESISAKFFRQWIKENPDCGLRTKWPFNPKKGS